jgi:hypothetical protein
LDIDKEIVSYLSNYGNTKESDLIGYGVQHFDRSAIKMKKILDRMVIKGRIYRIVHNKLKPPEVYISLEELLYPEIMRDLLEAEVKETVGEDVQRILEEAAAAAENRMKEGLQNQNILGRIVLRDAFTRGCFASTSKGSIFHPKVMTCLACLCLLRCQ